jgi:hypothetical protein
MNIKKLKRRLVDVRLALIGYKSGSEPDWLRIKRLASFQARVEESDERALAAITDEVRRHPDAAREARERLAPHIFCYEADRAVRLIDAAVHGSPVQPIRPDHAELFEQEARLGRMPLRDAFAEVVSRETELEHIRQRLEESHAALMSSSDERTEHASSHDAFVILRDAQREVDRIIGPLSQHPDPLLRSYIPRNIAYCWLRSVSGTPPPTDPDVSYFSRLDSGRPGGQ